MSKIRDLRLLIGAAALATAGTSAAFAVVGVTSSVGTLANQLCYSAKVSGDVNRSVGPICEPTNLPVACSNQGASTTPLTVEATFCVPD